MSSTTITTTNNKKKREREDLYVIHTDSLCKHLIVKKKVYMSVDVNRIYLFFY